MSKKSHNFSLFLLHICFDFEGEKKTRKKSHNDNDKTCRRRLLKDKQVKSTWWLKEDIMLRNIM